jgi:hypothetical protein
MDDIQTAGTISAKRAGTGETMVKFRKKGILEAIKGVG